MNKNMWNKIFMKSTQSINLSSPLWHWILSSKSNQNKNYITKYTTIRFSEIKICLFIFCRWFVPELKKGGGTKKLLTHFTGLWLLICGLSIWARVMPWCTGTWRASTTSRASSTWPSTRTGGPSSCSRTSRMPTATWPTRWKRRAWWSSRKSVTTQLYNCRQPTLIRSTIWPI